MAHAETHHDSHSHHIVPIKTYVLVFAALLALMVLTIVAAENPFPNSFVNNSIAMLIALVKASLVVAYFMGVKFASKLTKAYAYLGFVWVLTMLIMLCDYTTRQFEVTRGWDGSKQAEWSQMNLPVVDEKEKAKAHLEEGGGGH